MISSRLAPLLLVDVLLNISVQVDDHYFYIFIFTSFLFQLIKHKTRMQQSLYTSSIFALGKI